jgi:hypothetical protein
VSGVRSTSSLRGVGAVLLTVGGFVAAVLVWRLAALASHRSSAVGDGSNPATYGFPLAPAAVPAHRIVASGMPKDGLPALCEPAVSSRAALAAATGRSKLLLGSDPVAGLELGGKARAYPLRFLVWHEVVNDTLGGEPIAVAHSPLTATTVAFRRQVGGRTLVLRVSGLLVNSGHLLYDPQGSLWSPLLLRPVTGPAVTEGAELEPLPLAICSWEAWCQAHPDTTVIRPDPALQREYRRDPYSSYFGSDLLRFPVDPLPPHPAYPLKEPLVAVRIGARLRAFPFQLVEQAADDQGHWTEQVEGVLLNFVSSRRPRTVTVTAAGGPLPTLYAAYFAWYAAYGPATIATRGEAERDPQPLR